MRRIAFVAAMMVCALFTATAGATVGSTAVYSTSNGDNGPGTAQDYRFTAGTSETVDQLNVYLDGSSTAAKVELGIYSGTSTSATTLRGKCAITAPAAGWNHCAITAYGVTAGSTYWLAVLQPSGISGHLVYREGVQSGISTYLASGSKSTLPATWANNTGAHWTGYAGSLYANQATPPPPPPPPPADSDGDGVPDSNDQCPGTPAGTQVDSTGCPVSQPPPPPPPPPSGFPDASNTGIPAGTTLTAHSGDLTVTQDNAVVDGVDVSGCIDVRGINVTIKNTRAWCMSTAWSARAADPANPPLTIQDSEIVCKIGYSNTAIMFANINVLRTNIHGCENGLSIDTDVVVKDSFIHDLYQCPIAGCPEPGSPHTDGIESSNGSNVVIDHNTIHAWTSPCTWPDHSGTCDGGTSAININNSSGGPHTNNTTISNNLLDGGQQTLYCPIPSVTNFHVTDNHFDTEFSPVAGEGGPSTDCSSGGEILSGNTWYPSGNPITLN